MNHQREPSGSMLGSLGLIGLAPIDASLGSEQRRQRVVLRLERLIDDVWAARQRRRRLRVVGLAVTAAATAAAGIALMRHQPKGAIVASLRTPARLVAATGRISVRAQSGDSSAGRVGQLLAARDELTVEPSGTARLVLNNGAQIQVDGASRLQIAPDTGPDGPDVLSLDRGVINLSVPRLGPGQRLSIATRQALVTVVGTRFWVAVVASTQARPQASGRDSNERTCVGVSEGEVRITTRNAVQSLKANEQWSSDGLPCAEPDAQTSTQRPTSSHEPTAATEPTQFRTLREPRPTSPSVTANDRVDRQQPKPGATAADRHSPPIAAFEDSSLEEQNQLFAAAVAARQAAQPARAVAILSTLLSRYPDSPLAAAAARELDRARREANGQEPGPSGS